MTDQVTVIYWRDIPVQVMGGKGRGAVRIQLPDRFLVAADRAATRAKMTAAEDYAGEFRKIPADGADPQLVADRLDTDYSDTELDDLVREHGRRVDAQ